VDLVDFSSFALYWQDTGCSRCSGADLTCDANVDLNDLREFATHWLVEL